MRPERSETHIFTQYTLTSCRRRHVVESVSLKPGKSFGLHLVTRGGCRSSLPLSHPPSSCANMCLVPFALYAPQDSQSEGCESVSPMESSVSLFAIRGQSVYSDFASGHKKVCLMSSYKNFVVRDSTQYVRRSAQRTGRWGLTQLPSYVHAFAVTRTKARRRSVTTNQRSNTCASCPSPPVHFSFSHLFLHRDRSHSRAVRCTPNLLLNSSRREATSSALFFKHNSALGPPYNVIVDTNFINFSIKNKMDMVKGMMDCLYAQCVPHITDCVMAELEKLGQKFRVALRVAKVRPHPHPHLHRHCHR